MKEQQQIRFKSTGKTILRLREERGLSQQELANLCSVDRAKISRMENGRADFMHSTLLEIADALKVDVSILVASPEEPNPVI